VDQDIANIAFEILCKNIPRSFGLAAVYLALIAIRSKPIGHEVSHFVCCRWKQKIKVVFLFWPKLWHEGFEVERVDRFDQSFPVIGGIACEARIWRHAENYAENY
jgi:hypothetical protein